MTSVWNRRPEPVHLDDVVVPNALEPHPTTAYVPGLTSDTCSPSAFEAEGV